MTTYYKVQSFSIRILCGMFQRNRVLGPEHLYR